MRLFQRNHQSRSVTPVPISPIPPANFITVVRDMPGVGSTEAPSWSGRVDELLDFFTHFEELADSRYLNSAQRCNAVVRYINPTTQPLWKSFPEYETADYKAFKARIIHEYPGAEKGMQYSYDDLKRIVRAHGKSYISTENQLMEFSHEFRPVAAGLVKHGFISEYERDELFFQGLPERTRNAISHKLQFEDRNYREPPDFEKAILVGRKVLSENGFDVDKSHPRSARDLPAPPSHVKGTTSRPSKGKGKGKSRGTASRPSNAKVKGTESFGPYDDEDKHCYSNDAPQDVCTTTVRVDTGAKNCRMCGEGHSFKTCPVVRDYVNAGRIVRDGERFVTYPDGSRLHPHPDTGLLRTTIDGYYGIDTLPVYSEV